MELKLENEKSDFAVDEEKIADRIGIACFWRHFYQFSAMKTQKIYDGRKDNFKRSILSETTGSYLYSFGRYWWRKGKKDVGKEMKLCKALSPIPPKRIKKGTCNCTQNAHHEILFPTVINFLTFHCGKLVEMTSKACYPDSISYFFLINCKVGFFIF